MRNTPNIDYWFNEVSPTMIDSVDFNQLEGKKSILWSIPGKGKSTGYEQFIADGKSKFNKNIQIYSTLNHMYEAYERFESTQVKKYLILSKSELQRQMFRYQGFEGELLSDILLDRSSSKFINIAMISYSNTTSPKILNCMNNVIDDIIDEYNKRCKNNNEDALENINWYNNYVMYKVFCYLLKIKKKNYVLLYNVSDNLDNIYKNEELMGYFEGLCINSNADTDVINEKLALDLPDTFSVRISNESLSHYYRSIMENENRITEFVNDSGRKCAFTQVYTFRNNIYPLIDKYDEYQLCLDDSIYNAITTCSAADADRVIGICKEITKVGFSEIQKSDILFLKDIFGDDLSAFKYKKGEVVRCIYPGYATTIVIPSNFGEPISINLVGNPMIDHTFKKFENILCLTAEYAPCMLMKHFGFKTYVWGDHKYQFDSTNNFKVFITTKLNDFRIIKSDLKEISRRLGNTIESYEYKDDVFSITPRAVGGDRTHDSVKGLNRLGRKIVIDIKNPVHIRQFLNIYKIIANFQNTSNEYLTVLRNLLVIDMNNQALGRNLGHREKEGSITEFYRDSSDTLTLNVIDELLYAGKKCELEDSCLHKNNESNEFIETEFNLLNSFISYKMYNHHILTPEKFIHYSNLTKKGFVSLTNEVFNQMIREISTKSMKKKYGDKFAETIKNIINGKKSKAPKNLIDFIRINFWFIFLTTIHRYLKKVSPKLLKIIENYTTIFRMSVSNLKDNSYRLLTSYMRECVRISKDLKKNIITNTKIQRYRKRIVNELQVCINQIIPRFKKKVYLDKDGIPKTSLSVI
jgi:hypothetical protein